VDAPDVMTIKLTDVGGEGLSRVRLRRPDGARHCCRIRLASIRQLPRHPDLRHLPRSDRARVDSHHQAIGGIDRRHPPMRSSAR